MKVKNIKLDFDKNVKFKLFIDLNKITYSLLYRETEESLWAERIRKTFTILKNEETEQYNKNEHIYPTIENVSGKILEMYDEFIPLKEIETELMNSIENFSAIGFLEENKEE